MGVDKTDFILTTGVEGKKNLDKAFEDYHKLIVEGKEEWLVQKEFETLNFNRWKANQQKKK